ncbi:AAA family ATPase [Bradyrhizobium quebecense]|uniref:AAA family ATPase n=2 Tax=Bradyrhizobium quebecense TaxID=2748629 RepID=A0ABS3MBW7_9BRAD|nr:AAA family ATPase [Bradyrhizobium quebecense]UGY04319.1 AAA family ATPase [Bradyrhizobium quebecense]
MSAVLAASIPRNLRRRLRHVQALAVILQVPGPDWIEPVQCAFKHAFGPRWVTVGRNVSGWTPYAPDLSAQAADHLSEGRCVAAVCVGETHVPQSLRLTADHTIRIMPPDGEVLRRAILRFAGAEVDLEPGVGEGLAYVDLLACFRPGQGGRRIVDRLANASRLLTVQPDERLPNLVDAVEYGELQKWSLELGESIRLYRRKELSWSDLPHGICVAGPPGTGKSVWARSLARLCNCPIIFSSVPSWFVAGKTGYLDDCIRAVQKTFDTAAAAALAHGVAILMLDEVDALPSRASAGRNSDFWSAILAEVLLRLDSGSSSSRTGVIVISATNRPSALDDALLRPGRLERMVVLGPADAPGILSMLKFQVNGEVGESDLVEVAQLMGRATAAEVMATVREGRAIARRAGRPLEAADLKAALLGDGAAVDDRVFAHEAGHVVLALALSYGRVRHCAIGARVGPSNRTLIEVPEGSLATRSTLEDGVTMTLGGRAAEMALYGDCSIGAGGDEQSDVGLATKVISALRLSYCVADEMFFHGSPQEAVEAARCDPHLRRLVDEDLRRLQKRADAIVAEHLGAVIAIAQAMKSARYISGAELKRIFDSARPARKAGKMGRAGP